MMWTGAGRVEARERQTSTLATKGVATGIYRQTPHLNTAYQQSASNDCQQESYMTVLIFVREMKQPVGGSSHDGCAEATPALDCSKSSHHERLLRDKANYKAQLQELCVPVIQTDFSVYSIGSSSRYETSFL